MLERKVDFLIVGAQKCGTTALAHFLRQHPGIHVAGSTLDEQRSLHFFDRDHYFGRGSPDYAEYHREFHPRDPTQTVGECTPAYIYYNQAPTRIWQYNPNIKLIAVLRNPVERAFSNWNMERQRGSEDLDFHPACLLERKRGHAALPLQDLVHAYAARGFYAHQVRRLMQHFPDEQLLFLKYEQFQQDPLTAINKICRFLGVATLKHIASENVHKRSYARGITDQEHELLFQLFEKDIEALQRLLDWDCSDWLIPTGGLGN